MATITLLPQVDQSQRDGHTQGTQSARPRTAWFLLCAVLAFGLLGYHPFAEDGGIYATGVTLRLHPELFPTERNLPHSFAIAHTSQSLFVPSVAQLIRLLHLPQDWAMLLLFATALLATLLAAGSLARALFPSIRAQRGAVLLLAVSLGLPVAGTSLYLADPYLTARSLWTPLVLYGLSLLLRSRARAALLCLVVSAPLHPLMTVWAALLFATVMARRSNRPAAWTAGLAAATLAAMATLQAFAPPDSGAVRAASLSRGYWFLAQWEWYEWVGLVAAPVLLLLFATWNPLRKRTSQSGRDLCLALVIVAGIVTAAALLLIHPGDASLLLARMQPLRMLHPLYLVFVLMAGGLLGDLPQRLRCMPAAACIAAGIGLLTMQRGIYAHSGQWELPGATPANAYERAFLWVRDNTPVDAVFAADADYTKAPGEDAQMFRAVAQRTALPDQAKDGGIASVIPALAETWKRESDLQTGLATATDAQRLTWVRPLGATWLLLPAAAQTAFDCPFRNSAAKVCRLP
ncbi:hypothetical protein Terro_1435 [Terriglobus roseus DSM 18391]|uniref:Uncharacterized protein n=1 Tax=Terriglobus roseus (strain DSM 18391 / NRRL B-41598 / KBS 63) TaxID=926566 RepID=I3ZES5_TERRK|nr:hypothetical protein [Terriglobus roseus]AFL87743.1 hypothetical protein Terro_1435 [Terriglobus roseus DSM 18391]